MPGDPGVLGGDRGPGVPGDRRCWVAEGRWGIGGCRGRWGSRGSGRRRPLTEPRCQEEVWLDEEAPEEDWPPRIRCSDACDPSTLDTNNTRCLWRILQGLQHYRDLLDSDIFTARRLPQLETTLDKLLGLVQQEHGRPPRRPPTPSAVWAQTLLQHQALERLQSFTAVMSRVFTHSASTP
nr:interleukin-23 subunit alpha [Dromaius novaehollandiae]